MSDSFQESGLRTVRMEQEAIEQLQLRIDDQFSRACNLLLNCPGRIVVVGMGKSGHIGKKIAATLASTGSPAFFVHPGEASHGDLGMITSNDVVITLSNSGNTVETVTLIPLLKRLGVPMISMTGNADSTLAQAADVNLDTSVLEEACPLNLAPTSSTTVSLVMGDALAIALLENRGFSSEDFAFSHPGGALGRRLLLKVDDIMHSGERLPAVTEGTLLRDALLEMTQKGLGMTAIVNPQGKLNGVFTDGDLRRSLDRELNMATTLIDDVMTINCKTITVGTLAAEAVHVMEETKINGLIVVDAQQNAVGALNMHDLLRAGVV